jgi:ornithine lipid ester-linked acyl 2-hydroxylase
MSVDKMPIWYGVYGKEYQGPEPAFFDNDFPWKRELLASFPAIRDALEPLMQNSDDLRPYFDEALQYPPKNWKTIGFCFWGKKDSANLRRFPVIAKILSNIPGLLTASFNLLEPHSHIKPHFGDTSAVYRIHLGVRIPASLPVCGFTVSGESRSWEEGNALIFLDANTHEAFNQSNERRYILLLDIIRPEFESHARHVCIKVLSILSLYFLMARIPFFPVRFIQRNVASIPKWMIDLVLLPLRASWFFYLPCHNFLNHRRLVD